MSARDCLSIAFMDKNMTLRTCSVPDFNKVFDIIELSLRPGIIKSMEDKEIFIQAESIYKEFSRMK